MTMYDDVIEDYWSSLGEDFDLESQYEDRNGDPDFNTDYPSDRQEAWYDSDDDSDPSVCDCFHCLNGDPSLCILNGEDSW